MWVEIFSICDFRETKQIHENRALLRFLGNQTESTKKQSNSNSIYFPKHKKQSNIYFFYFPSAVSREPNREHKNRTIPIFFFSIRGFPGTKQKAQKQIKQGEKWNGTFLLRQRLCMGSKSKEAVQNQKPTNKNTNTNMNKNKNSTLQKIPNRKIHVAKRSTSSSRETERERRVNMMDL